MSDFKNKIILLDESVIHFFSTSIHIFHDCKIYIPFQLFKFFETKHTHIESNFNNDFINFIRQIQQEKQGQTLDLQNNSTLNVWTLINDKMELHGFDRAKINDIVLMTALEILEQETSLILITNSKIQKMRAQFLGIETSDYFLHAPQLIYEKIDSLKIIDQEVENVDYYEVFQNENLNYYANQYLNLISEDCKQNRLMRFDQKKRKFIKSQIFTQATWNIFPKNIEQQAALDAMLLDQIDLVILAGKAGTGKTLLALAAALELLSKKNEIKKILVSRPFIPLGNDLGYLPGSLDEKMSPWMQPIFDNLSILTFSQSSQKKESATYHQLLEKKLLEIEPLTYIRGRSIQKSILIVDEAQNLTMHEMKTIITRVGEGSKLILTGDPFQIDNPKLNEYNNGLSYVIKKFKSYENTAHIFLHKGERSKLAELAANVL